MKTTKNIAQPHKVRCEPAVPLIQPAPHLSLRRRLLRELIFFVCWVAEYYDTKEPDLNSFSLKTFLSGLPFPAATATKKSNCNNNQGSFFSCMLCLAK